MVHVPCQYGKEVTLNILGFIASNDGTVIVTNSGGVFCWSRNQAREVVSDCVEPDRVQDLEDDMETAGLPEESDRVPIEIDKDSANTILGMIQDLGHFFGTSPGDMTVFINIPTGRPYYAFGPTSRDVKNALVGWSNPAGEHFMAIYYSQEQARGLVQEHFSWIPDRHKGKLLDAILHPELPETSSDEHVIITGSTIGWINFAHYAKMDTIRRAGPVH